MALLLLAFTAWRPLAANTCATPISLEPTAAPDTLRLHQAIDGATDVRLAGIDIPQSTSAASDAIAQAAAQAISRATEGRTFCLAIAADGVADRYGRLLAQVYRDDGLWLQRELLALGLARVVPTPDARERVAEMLTIESQARADRLGLWRSAAFRVRTADDAVRAPAGYEIVEGRVVDAERRQDRWYLNFGEDWRSDFTIIIPKQGLAEFTRAGVDPFSLKGQRVRVRGWLQSLNGPMIEVLVPEQIEILKDSHH